jgi:hypothetical protein
VSEARVHHLDSSKRRSRSVGEMATDGSQNVKAGMAFRSSDSPIQRGFATHSLMLAPMTVKNIPIAMMIAAQPMTWIVAIARFEILVRISSLSTRKALSKPRGIISIGYASRGSHESGMTPYRQMCVEIWTTVDPIVPARSIFICMQY